MNLYVGNLSEETTREQLVAAFTKHGAVRSVRMPGDRMKNGQAAGPHRGYGFVVMTDPTQARAAVAALDKQSMGGRTVSVRVANLTGTPS